MMQTLAWDAKYDTGVDKIDDQHKKLFDQVNKLGKMLDSGVLSGPEVDQFVDFLGSYVTSHFSFEELCMRNMNCPVLEENKTAHKRFLDFFGSFKAKYDKDGSSRAILEKLHKSSSTWLVNHICKVDVNLRHCA